MCVPSQQVASHMCPSNHLPPQCSGTDAATRGKKAERQRGGDEKRGVGGDREGCVRPLLPPCLPASQPASQHVYEAFPGAAKFRTRAQKERKGALLCGVCLTRCRRGSLSITTTFQRIVKLPSAALAPPAAAAAAAASPACANRHDTRQHSIPHRKDRGPWCVSVRGGGAAAGARGAGLAAHTGPSWNKENARGECQSAHPAHSTSSHAVRHGHS